MADQRDYFTVEEVMAHLRMGRTFVYQEARRFLATSGAEGIPCRKFGRLLRFPATELQVYATTRPERPAAPPVTSPSPRPTHRRTPHVEQPSLFEA